MSAFAGILPGRRFRRRFKSVFLSMWTKIDFGGIMEKIVSLCRNYEFQRLYRRGKSAVRHTIVVYAFKNRSDDVRLGITAGKKVGNAVSRNRAKRRIRELFRTYKSDIKRGVDICIVARNAVIDVPYDKLVRDFKSAMDELSLWIEK
jgi:ribonuclease P protein component